MSWGQVMTQNWVSQVVTSLGSMFNRITDAVWLKEIQI